MERVGIRELRQNLSRYLRKVERGVTFEVTERGQPVAVLAPLPLGAPLARLAARGRLARPPRAPLATLEPPQSYQPGAVSLRDALDQEREERL
jgi:prevent-host-death family protein